MALLLLEITILSAKTNELNITNKYENSVRKTKQVFLIFGIYTLSKYYLPDHKILDN